MSFDRGKAEVSKMCFKVLFFFYSISLRNNNITDEGIRKLIAKGIQCDCFLKIA